MALLGKISAVLTASTADFTKKIGLAKDELSAFQKRVSGIQLSLNTRALDGTLTKIQKFKREVDELRRLRGLGVDLGFDPRRLTEQFKAFEEIGKPLTDVKNKIEGLSLSIQAELYPELEKVSSGFRNLYRDIETGVTTWDKSEKRVTALTASLSRLSRATAAAADFGRLSASLRQETAGASFFQPRAQESLQRSRALRDQAAQVPARFRSDAFAALADSADENAARIERQAARVIAIEARIARQGATPNLLNARSVAQDNLDNLTRRQEAINAGFQRQIRESRLASIISPEDVSAVDLFATRLESLSSQLRAIDSQQFEGLISGATAVVRQFNAGEVSAKKAKQAVDALAASLNSVNTGRSLENQTRSLLFTDAERRRQQIQSDFDRERNSGARGAEQKRDVNLTRERLNNEIIPRTRNLQQQASESGDVDLQRRAERLTQLGRQINNELSKATRSANNGQVDAANQSIAKANTLLGRQLELERQISRELDEINAARRQQDMFLEASGGRGELLSQGARDAAADISTARQFRGQIASGASRIAIQAEIDQVTTSVTRLQREIARVANSNLGSREKIAELDRLDNEIRQSTQGLARTVAQYSGGAFSEQQVAAAMRLSRNTAGSISTRGAAAAQLAIQQGLFAIDDLISSTGGLEYKLRAVGNNITQLGLLLGQSGVIPGLTATTGLFIGLATVLGGQAVSAIVRWYNEGRTAEDQTKALNDALARQKSLAEELARAFESLGDSIADRAFSRSAQEARAFQRELDAIIKKQREAREASVVDAAPGIGAVRADQNRINRELQEEVNPGRRAALQQQLEESQQIEQRLRGRALAQVAPSGQEVRALLDRVLGAFEANAAAIRRRGAPATEGTLPLLGLRERLDRDARVAALPANIQGLIRNTDFGADTQAIETQIRALKDAIGLLSPIAGDTFFGFETVGSQATKAVELIRELAARLGAIKVDEELNNASTRILSLSDSVSRGIVAAQESLAASISSGTPGAAAVEKQLNSLSQRLAAANTSLAEAQGLASPQRRAQQQVAEENIRNIQREFEARNDVISSVESFAQALDRAAGQVADSALRDAEGRAQQARRNANELFARAFSPDALGVRDEDRVQQARQADRVARRAEDDFSAAQERNRRFAAQRDSAIQGFSRQAAAGTLGRDLQAVIGQLSQARRDSSNTTLPAGQREAASRLVQTLERQLSEAFERTPAARRLVQQANTADVANQINAQLDRDREQFNQSVSRGRDFLVSPQQRQSQELQQQLDDATNAALQGFLEPLRGGIFPQRAQAEVDAIRSVIDDEIITLAEIGQLFQKFPGIRDELRGPVEQAIAQLEGVRGNIEDNGIAAQLAENRANAALQGPSRAALSASDITTGEGQRELNRLLRGDDPARDVNLEEARKQNTKLDQVNEHLDKLRQIFAGVAD